ncbi:AP-1 complex subunit sigma-1 [Gonapodya prolifera JEL478]|uniref:AP complex subunit sigma n=1 Tax=Gonapodya prolifera (strain JEL478) TaxID=1344416 RepID=A0A139API0_GONPJ|nr:AP-1 complex subunit sigma-1 [Gonapodya prolifera JEL478]|eukprot:KXS18632.1 AP-1 complex subunit sigma-1 [Gonapodya prolifera JEL478]
MTIHFMLLVNRQGKTRLSRWYKHLPPKDKARYHREVGQLVTSRTPKMTNVVDHKDFKLVYRRYASLYFIVGVDADENELIMLEVIHRYVELLDRYFGNVCELDLIYNFHKAYYVLDELVMAGEMIETSKKTALRAVTQQDSLAEQQEDGEFEGRRNAF